ncbi:hypothetical protein Lalb_Chr20g0121901 [Lupinus albus]|uniref:RING-type E3 ubiquitin transferase n=1 Tax=Lupinus albus TaxID=3870 RepID=A0A6A4NWL0_LUPAL|nr:hypothetical protein Lalb_Chr20g0121901 [Lupinus albus]
MFMNSVFVQTKACARTQTQIHFMNFINSSSSSSFHRSRFSKTHYLIFFISILCNFSYVSSNLHHSLFQTSYLHLCNHVVPLSTPRLDSPTDTAVAESLRFRAGYFNGGDPLFNKSISSNYSTSLSFNPISVRRTLNDAVCELRAQLLLQLRITDPNPVPGRLLRKVVYPGRRVSHWRASQWMRVSLRGFWSQSSGKLCMIGIGSYANIRDANVLVKLSYPLDLTVLRSFVTGTVESFDDKNSLGYFEPISILGLSQSLNYKFTLMGNENGNGCVGRSDGVSLSLNNLSQGACTVFRGHVDRFELEYGSQCDNISCNPLGWDTGKLLAFMYFRVVRCVERRRFRMILGFPDSSYGGTVFPFYPNTTLVSEGIWDEKENQLCAVACRILKFNGSSVNNNPQVGDCSIRLKLRFPAVLSLRNRSTVLGQIWSDKAVGESGYFSKIEFEGSLKGSRGIQGLQYKFTEIDRVSKSCAEKITATGKGNTYPDGYSSDMRFSMFVRNSKGQVTEGYSSPLFVSGQSYDEQLYGVPSMLTRGKLKANRIHNNNLLNVSYMITFNPPPDFKFGGVVSSTEVKIDAEGLYNMKTGLLCMIGCLHLRSKDKILIKNESLDCEILVTVQFPPLNAIGGESVKGTIESIRQKSDHYYFDPLQLSSYSISTSQADASIWRMDFEIIMVLMSNTLACVFVGLQLLHVKKHPDVLPNISIVMLVVITLGHMIPLVLNFEALFMANHNQQNPFLGSGGWLEVNEVVVRMVTMIAFLLELRLLQLTWSSRQDEGSEPDLWVSEKKVLYMTLPLYFSGGLTAWFVHIWKSSHQKRFKPLKLSRHRFRFPREPTYQSLSLWEDFKSYAGLLLDGFLLPQILFNILFNPEGKALACSFYAGTTIVRILPHAYDLYRAHSSAWFLDSSYIYADHRMDFYSTTWDIIIPIGGLLFALLVYFQQRFGSRFILPKRARESSYEKVPVIGNDDL